MGDSYITSAPGEYILINWYIVGLGGGRGCGTNTDMWWQRGSPKFQKVCWHNRWTALKENDYEQNNYVAFKGLYYWISIAILHYCNRIWEKSAIMEMQ